MKIILKYFGSYLSASVFGLYGLILLTTAVNSKGFYHWDEHYQVVEFASFKMGVAKHDDMPWEFNEQIRPASQPAIAFVAFKVMNKIGVHSPFLHIFALRLVAAVLSLTVVFVTFLYLKRRFDKVKPVLIAALCCGFWFLPFIGVRFSSETFSAAFIGLGIIPLLDYEHRKQRVLLVFAGLSLALAFQFRFQSLLVTTGVVMWLVIKDKTFLRSIYLFAIPFMFIVFVGIMVDSWFYGNGVLTPLKYLARTLLSGTEDEFGVMPWYFYLSETIVQATVFIGLLILVGCVSFVIKFWKSMITGGVLLFIVFHFFIPHKEIRFMFPLVFLLPIVFSELLFGTEWFKTRYVSYVVILFVVFNIPLMIYMAFRPAHTEIADIQFASKYRNEVIVYYTIDNPAQIYYYYKIPSEASQYQHIDASRIDTINKRNKPVYLFLTSLDLPKVNPEIMNRLRPVHSLGRLEQSYFEFFRGKVDEQAFSRALYQLQFE